MDRWEPAFSRFSLIMLLTSALAVIPTREASAVNTGFLPGDCCYHFLLTRELYLRFEKEDGLPIELRYSRPEWVEFSLCGDAGYWVVDGRELDPQVKVGLRKAYQMLREHSFVQYQVLLNERTGEERKRETNALSVIIYNESCNISEYGLFIKYNEEWPNESVQWSWGSESIPVGRYFPFLSDKDSMMKEWFRSADVESLATKLSLTLLETVGQECNVPLSLTKPIKLVVTAHKAEDFANPKDGMEIVVVTAKDVTKYEYRPKRGWVEPGAKVEDEDPE